METWQQILSVILLVGMLFFIWPSVRAGIERSKHAEEKHWGSFAFIVLAIIGFIALLIMSVQ